MTGFCLALNAVNPAFWDKMPFRTLLRMILAQWEHQQSQKTYQTYTAETQHYICESVTQRLGGWCIANKYTDFIGKPEPTESGAEIIGRIGAKLDAMGGDKDSESA